METIDLNSPPKLYELTELAGDPKIVRALRDCVDLQRSAAETALRADYRPRADALNEVSEERLQQLLRAGAEVEGIRKEREISNVIIFNDERYAGAVISEKLAQRRGALNRLVIDRVSRLFHPRQRLSVTSSGFFLYPPQCCMSWHTNAQNPGWRMYVTYADDPGKSFIRYQDPATGAVHTSWDRGVDVRLFRVETQRPLWHAIYSNTHRFSIGYRIRPDPSLLDRLLRAAPGRRSRSDD